MASISKSGQSAEVDPDYPLEAVPTTARRSLLSVSVVLLGFTFFTPTMFAGADLGAAFSLSDLMGVIAVGSIVLGAYVGAVAIIGARTGLTSVLLSRYTLGRKGAKWADLVLGGTQIGWFAVTVGFFALVTAGAFGLGDFGLNALIIGGSIVMGATAYYGYRGMELLSVVAVPLMTILCFWVLFRAFGDAEAVGGFSSFTTSGRLTWGAGVTIVVGTFASGGTQVANWSRFARSTKDAAVAGLLAFFLANALMLGFGAIGGLVYQTPDFSDVLIAQGLAVWGVLLLLLNYWTTGDNTAYAFGVAGAEMFDRPTKKPFIIWGVVIATVLALMGFYTGLGTWLTLLGVFIPPLGGAIIGDHLFVWRGRPLPDMDSLPALRWSCIMAYLLGTAAAYASSTLGVGIPPLNGILVAVLAVPVMEAVLKAAGKDQLADLRG
jgi:cytosine permease